VGSDALQARGAGCRPKRRIRRHPRRHALRAATRLHLAAPAHRGPADRRQRVRHEPEDAQRPLLIPDRGPAAPRAAVRRRRVARRTHRPRRTACAGARKPPKLLRPTRRQAPASLSADWSFLSSFAVGPRRTVVVTLRVRCARALCEQRPARRRAQERRAAHRPRGPRPRCSPAVPEEIQQPQLGGEAPHRLVQDAREDDVGVEDRAWPSVLAHSGGAPIASSSRDHSAVRRSCSALPSSKASTEESGIFQWLDPGSRCATRSP
jgi:hypothetical protein